MEVAYVQYLERDQDVMITKFRYFNLSCSAVGNVINAICGYLCETKCGLLLSGRYPTSRLMVILYTPNKGALPVTGLYPHSGTD